MKKLCLLLVAMMLAMPLTAFAQDKMTGNSPKIQMTVIEPMLVGAQMVKPGEYRFQCVTIDGTEYLVVTSTQGKEIVRVPCKPESLASKITMSSLRTVLGPTGAKVLKSVQLKGETIAHTVVLAE